MPTRRSAKGARAGGRRAAAKTTSSKRPAKRITTKASKPSTLKAAATTRGANRQTETIARGIKLVGTKEPRQIEGSDSILVLQFSAPGNADAETFAAEALAGALSVKRDVGKGARGWEFFLATDRLHAEGFSTWLGIGKGVPLSFVDSLQRVLGGLGCEVRREYAVIAHCHLRPLLAVTDAAFEVPLASSALDEQHRRQIDVPAIRRPFSVSLNAIYKSDLLAKLMLGSDESAVKNFPFRYFQDDGAATFAFGRVSLQMFGQSMDGSYMAMTKVSDTPPCVLSFDFQGDQLERLAALIPQASREELLRNLSEGTRLFRVPPGSVVVGVRAKRGVPEPNDTIPFVTLEFLPAADIASFSVEF